MSSNRIMRVNELLKRELAMALPRLLPSEQADPSRVTISRVEISPNLRNANVGVSILGSAGEKQQVMNALQRCRKDFQKTVSSNITLKYTPRIHFHLDESIEAGDRVLGLLYQLEQEEQQKAHPQNDE